MAPSTTPAETTQLSVTVAPPSASQPAPLQLHIPAGAAKAARSGIRSMADSAGTYMGDEKASSQERLAEEVAKAGKTDCLAPNPNGSLLSSVVIAYEAGTGKCK